jgi:hypothetical protein
MKTAVTPQFLKINENPTKQEFNKHLPFPFVHGEVIQVHTDQSPSEFSEMTEEKWQSLYLRVNRKENGKFGRTEVICKSWTEPLKLKK